MSEHGRGGVIGHRPYCVCGQEGVYDDYHDTYYCPVSGEWVEPACECPEGECPFPKRPAKKEI